IPIAGVQGVALLVGHEQQLILAGLANTRPDRGLYKDWEIELFERSEHEREVKIDEQSCQNHSKQKRAESVNRVVGRPNDGLLSPPVGFRHGVFPPRFRRRTARRPRARRGACWFLRCASTPGIARRSSVRRARPAKARWSRTVARRRFRS